MHVPDVHDYTVNQDHKEAIKPFLSEGQRKAVKRDIEQIVDGEFDRLEEFANDYIGDVAAARAEKFLERVLEGDNEAAIALLGDKSGGSRIRQSGCEDGKPWASLIHGRLFETNMVKLRRQIVEAHSDLLKSERIADLEATVKGLSQQIRELERLNEALG